MNMSQKKIIGIVVGALVLIVLVIGIALWNTNPQRTVDNFIKAVESGNRKAAMTFVNDSIKKSRYENIEWFVEDWTIAEQFTATKVTDEAWRSRIKMTTNENGESVPEINDHGYETREQTPTPKYWASHYRAFVNVNLVIEGEEYEDPVIIKLKRNTEDEWGKLGQLFRGWKITRITYQPLGEEGYGAFDLDELDFEDGEMQFEVDEEGNLVPVDSGDSDEGTDGGAEGTESESSEESTNGDAEVSEDGEEGVVEEETTEESEFENGEEGETEEGFSEEESTEEVTL